MDLIGDLTITEESQVSALQSQQSQSFSQKALKQYQQQQKKDNPKLKKLNQPFSFDIIRSKDIIMPGTKMSMFNYYYVLPRCAICHQIGYSPTAKFKRYQRKEHGSKLEQKIMHANELGYLLFDCQDCGLMVHPQCFGNIFVFSQILYSCGVNGMEEKLDIEKLKWKCPDCQVKKEDHENKNCSICYQNYQSQEVFKNMKTQGQRAHLFCAMWNEKTSALDLCKQDKYKQLTTLQFQQFSDNRKR